MCSVGNKRGFTLLELLLTLAILAIAASLVGPGFLRMLDNRRVDWAGREISAALRQAREQAIREQRVLLVKFDAKDRKVQLIEAGGKVLGEVSLPLGVRVREIRTGGSLAGEQEAGAPETETPEEPLAVNARGEPLRTLVFAPTGAAEDAQIVLENERGRQVRVRMDAFTGMARVERVAQAVAP